MTGTVLLTLGRLPKALDIARAFAAIGWRVVIAEPFRWHLSRMSRDVAACHRITAPAVSRERYLTDLLAVIQQEKVTLVVPVSEESMHAAHLADRLPAGVRLFGMPAARLLALHDKQNFIRVAAGYGLPVPETFAAASPEAAAFAREHDHVVKPIFSCSGIGVSIRRKGEPLPEGLPADNAIVQAFVPGAVRTSFSVLDRGRPLVTVVYRGVVMSGTVAVCFERVEEPAVMAWVERFARASGDSGFVSFDFVVDDAGRAFAIECNPRATSGVHFVEPGDLARAIVDPGTAAPIRLRAGTLRQQFFPCLTETQASLFRGGNIRRNVGYLVRAADVTWSWRDPLPLLTMPITAANIIRLAVARGATFGEVAMLDVGWFTRDGSPPA